jgi:hypothetical protein
MNTKNPQEAIPSTTPVVTSPENLALSNKIDSQVALVLADKSVGIEKALVVARAMEIIDSCLTAEIMNPIMRLQGSKLGFKTDKDIVRNPQTSQYERGTGYPLEVVKNCFVEMSLIGLQPVFNQWNIIGGNSYVTKEGADTLLKNIPYLQEHLIIHEEVNQSVDKKTASVKSKIQWVIDGEQHTQIITFPVKSDAYTTHDALIGKADRKSKIWLFNKIKGTCISDGDADEAKIIDVTPPKPNAAKVDDIKTVNRILKHIEKSTDVETLEKCYEAIGDDTDLLIVYNDKKRELLKSK